MLNREDYIEDNFIINVLSTKIPQEKRQGQTHYTLNEIPTNIMNTKEEFSTIHIYNIFIATYQNDLMMKNNK